MQNKLEFLLFNGISKIFRFTGLNFARKFAHLLALVFYYLIPIRKETVFDNLSHAFPGYSPDKIKSIAFGTYKSFAIALVEILYLPWLSEKELNAMLEIDNIELVRKKYNEQNGVILLSAHFGNWELSAASMGARLGIPLHVIVKPQRNPLVTDWLNSVRTKWGNEVVSLGISIRQIYKVLKEKKITAMVADQRGPAEGIRINFFGRQASVYAGPAILSLKTGAPLLYGIAVRQPDYSYKMEMVEISRDNLPESDEEKIVVLCQRLAAYLEEVIRKHPEQWLWMHKRWKY